MFVRRRRLAAPLGLALALAPLSACTAILGIGEPGDGSGSDDTDGTTPDAAVDIDASIGPDARTHVHLRVHVGGSATLDGDAGPAVTSDPPGIACPPDCDEDFTVGTPLMLTANPDVAPAATFTGLRSGGCTGGDTCGLGALNDDAEVYARWWTAFNHVFVTSEQRAPGSFDGGASPGIANVDAWCQELAEEAGVPGNFRAWLPTGASTAPQRILTGHPFTPSGWLRTDGLPFAFTLANLTGSGMLFSPARLDEWGRDVGDDALVATDTTPSGAAAAGDHCLGYTSEAAPGGLVAGEAAGGSGRFTSVGMAVSCATPAHYYCFASNINFAIPLLAPQEAILFVSDGTMTGGEGVARADQLCAESAQMAVDAMVLDPRPTAMAIIAEGSASPAQRFADWGFNGPIQRADGVVVAQTKDTLFAGELRAAPNVTAQRQYVNTGVWLGAGALDALHGGSCQAWTSSDAGEFGVSRPAATTRGASAAQSESCDQPRRVMCLYFAGFMSKPSR